MDMLLLVTSIVMLAITVRYTPMMLSEKRFLQYKQDAMGMLEGHSNGEELDGIARKIAFSIAMLMKLALVCYYMALGMRADDALFKVLSMLQAVTCICTTVMQANERSFSMQHIIEAGNMPVITEKLRFKDSLNGADAELECGSMN